MQPKPSLSLYSFNEMWQPGMMVVLASVIVLYFLLITRWRGRFAQSNPVPFKKRFYFVAGVLLYYAAECSPWKVFGDYMFTAHMISMTLAFISVPPLIYLGMPDWFWKPILKKPILLKILRICTAPFIVVVLFNMAFSFYHLPFIFNFLVDHGAIMVSANYFLLILGFLMWWPVITPLPEMGQLSYLMKMAYLFMDGMLLTPACALLAFSNVPVFEIYVHAPRLVWFMTPMWDQQAAGVFMKVLQETTYGVALLFVIYKWATQERKSGKTDDPFAASAMSQSLRRMEPHKNEN